MKFHLILPSRVQIITKPEIRRNRDLGFVIYIGREQYIGREHSVWNSDMKAEEMNSRCTFVLAELTREISATDRWTHSHRL